MSFNNNFQAVCYQLFKSENEDGALPVFDPAAQMIETTGSLLTNLLPKKIHATSALGFELKVVLFVLACSLNYLFKVAT